MNVYYTFIILLQYTTYQIHILLLEFLRQSRFNPLLPEVFFSFVFRDIA